MPVAILRGAFWIFLSVTVAVVVELLVAGYSDGQSGIDPIQLRYMQEKAHFLDVFRQQRYVINPHDFRSFLDDLVDVGTDKLQRIQLDALHSKFEVSSSLRSLFERIEGVLRVCALRLSAIAGFAPIVLIVSLLCICDGCVRREVRRRSAGRESAVFYHVSKRLLRPTVAWVTLAYIALPIALSPLTIYVTFVTSIPILTCTMASRYKKYI